VPFEELTPAGVAEQHGEEPLLFCWSFGVKDSAVASLVDHYSRQVLLSSRVNYSNLERKKSRTFIADPDKHRHTDPLR
jgi:hypothetical protein